MIAIVSSRPEGFLYEQRGKNPVGKEILTPLIFDSSGNSSVSVFRKKDVGQQD